MAEFRYDTTHRWYKGNVHIHSTVSDGGKDFAELAAMYAEAGYDFLARTDHGTCSDVAADEAEYPLLWLDGIELAGADYGGSFYHVVCLGTLTGIEPETPFVPALEAARAQGAITILAHPYWTGNTPADALRYGLEGVEVYNHVVRWLNGKSEGGVHWNAMLGQSPNTLAFATDDTHARTEHPGWNGGWIVVNAPECTREALMAAMRAGNFYSSCGPEFHAIEFDGENVTLTTSPVQFVRLTGTGSQGSRQGAFDGTLRTETTLTVPPDWPYVYAEIEDDQGRRAWTNPLFIAP